MLNYLQAMQTYFESERNLGFFFVPLGLVAFWAAFWAWRNYDGGFRQGIVIPLVVFGILFVSIGVTVGRQATTRLDDFPARFKLDPQGLQAEEATRMERVNGAWAALKWAWAITAVIGALLALLVPRDWAAPLGAMLMLFAGMAMITDVIAERRARIYAEAVLQMSD